MNRPDKANAFNMLMWEEYEAAFTALDADSGTRCVVLEGEGANFCAGMDLGVFAQMSFVSARQPCEGRTREALAAIIAKFQHQVGAPERCKVRLCSGACGKKKRKKAPLLSHLSPPSLCI